MKRTDLIVVGAGPAGIAAAVTAASHGLEVALIDESPTPGGQVLLQNQPAQKFEGRAVQRGLALLEDLQRLPVSIYTQTIAWAVDGRRVAIAGPDCPGEIEASALLIASGAREFVPAFPGWTLPGVMTLGGAQSIIKRHNVLPGHSMLIAGAGPLTWALAAEILEHGGNLLGVLDYSRPADWLSMLPQFSALRDRVGLGMRYLRTIAGQRVPYHWTRDRLHAHGEGRLERVSIGSREFEVDVLCVGFGFIPNTELHRLAGCSMVFDRSLGGWIPIVDEDLQTSQTGTYTAGECAGVGGAQKALLEGELAAYSLLNSLGQPLSSRENERRHWLRRRRQTELRFARALNRSCEAPVEFLAELEHETIICRCENVRAGEIRTAHNKGISTLDGLKNELRVGQGLCQGRTCGPILRRMLAAADESPPVPFHVRPPVKPVTLSQIERRT